MRCHLDVYMLNMLGLILLHLRSEGKLALCILILFTEVSQKTPSMTLAEH